MPTFSMQAKNTSITTSVTKGVTFTHITGCINVELDMFFPSDLDYNEQATETHKIYYKYTLF